MTKLVCLECHRRHVVCDVRCSCTRSARGKVPGVSARLNCLLHFAERECAYCTQVWGAPAVQVARSQTRSTSRPPDARPAVTRQSSPPLAAHRCMPSRCARHACTTRACSCHVRSQKRPPPPAATPGAWVRKHDCERLSKVHECTGQGLLQMQCYCRA